MRTAFANAGARLQAFAPRAVVALSARWQSSGAFLVDPAKRHRTITDYAGFGVEVRYDCDGHPGLARAIVAEGERSRVRIASAQRGVDSGISVPMHFLAPVRTLPLVPVSLADQPAASCRGFGAALRRAIEAWPEPVAFVVGGMLSFNQHAWRLGRDVPEAGLLDEQVLDLIGRADWEGLATLDPKWAERAQPEAELRHLEVLHGFVGADVTGDVRCYEASPGTGSALVEWVLDPEAAARLPLEAPEPIAAPAPRPVARSASRPRSVPRPPRPPASRTGAAARPGGPSRTSSRPAPRPGSRPAARNGARPAPRPGGRPAPRPGARSAPRPGGRPAPRPGARPASSFGSRPAPRPGTRPAPRSSARPAPRPSARPTPRPGERPTSRAGAWPNSRPGARPSSRPGSGPSARTGGRPARGPRPTSGSRTPRPGGPSRAPRRGPKRTG